MICRSLVLRDLHLRDHGIERRDLDMQRTGSSGEQKDKTCKREH